jgi:hypothetical protein
MDDPYDVPEVTDDKWEAHRTLGRLARQLKCKPDEVPDRVIRLLAKVTRLLAKAERGDRRADKILAALRPTLAGAGAAALLAMALAPAVHADDTGSDLLVGSAQGFVLGPTGISDPAIFPGYTPTIEDDYLIPLGFSPNGTLTDLYTPESPWFGPSIAQGAADLEKAVEDAYNAGLITSSDPETIVGYSQSTVVMSQAMEKLYAYGIPSDDLRFVMLGNAASDPPSGPTGILPAWDDTALEDDVFKLLGWTNIEEATTPNDLYPVDTYDLPPGDDFWANTVPPADFATHPLESIAQDVVGFFEHGLYMGGLPETDILTAPAATDDLATYYTVAPPEHVIEALFTVALTNLGL